jgi:hypothetical protein
MGAWLTSKNSRTQGTYLPGKQYNRLLREELVSIRKKLNTVENGKRIFNNIQYAYNISSGRARRDTFLREIGLEIGAVEEQAITARHGMAHGDATAEQEQDNDLRQARRAYITLFERVLLKLLGYRGTYIDRSTLGFPDKPIDVPQGATRTASHRVGTVEVCEDGVWRRIWQDELRGYAVTGCLTWNGRWLHVRVPFSAES